MLKIICMSRNWDLGGLWLVDKEAKVLRSISIWNNSEWDFKNDVHLKSQKIPFRPGFILPRKVWKLGELVWIEDIRTANLIRLNDAARAGYRSAVGVPIFMKGEIIGVLDLFSRVINKPHEITKNMLKTISDQIGQYIASKLGEDQMIYASRHDAQTSLLNLSALRDNLKKLKVSPPNKLALILFEIDRFKLINSVIGNEAKDLLFKMIVDRFRKISPEFEDQFGRYDTNIFARYLTFHVVDELIQFSKALLNIFNEPFYINQQYFYLAANIGMSISSGSKTNINALFKQANFALDKSIKAGKNNFNFFSSELSDIVHEQLILETSLRNAFSNNEFCLYYQPKVNLKTGEISGVEALVRWQHPIKGLIMPADFIYLAEETGLIIQLDEWVLREVFKLIKNDWPLNPNGKGLIAINISPQHFKVKNDIFSYIKSLMQEFNVNPNIIEIEITESILLENLPYALKVLNKLVDMGFTCH